MNIEFETRQIIKGRFSKDDKIKMIQKFSNFKRENILFALNKRYEGNEDFSGQVYEELIRLK